MPTYAYECTDCGHSFEAIQKMSDNPLTSCETCGGTLRKRVFPVGIVFKGSGFYVNDYARKGSEPVSEAAAKPADSTAASDSKNNTEPAEPASTESAAAGTAKSPSASADKQAGSPSASAKTPAT